jgi:hypothetical protein
MSDAVLFAIVFLGFFVLRGIAATVAFYFILPDGDRCPICDAETLHIHSRFWNRSIPGLRPSWCPRCRWEGMLRRSRTPVVPATPVARPSGKEMPKL